MFITMFENMDNEYMKERASDIRDVTKRILSHLLGLSFDSPAAITEEVIVIAEDLTPSDTAQLNRQFVKGFAADIGGRTSHAAIMSRSMELPAVVGTKAVTEKALQGQLVILDGNAGEVILNPSEEELGLYKLKQTEFEQQKKEWDKLVND